MRSRAVLLPHPADPFLFNYWLKFYKNVWRDEIDKLYILVNSPIEKEVVEYIEDLIIYDPKIQMHYTDHQMEHGHGLNLLLDFVEEENVMLIEDDGFVWQKGVIDNYFTLLEQGKYDVIGSPRGSCGMDIWQIAQMRWDLDYSHLGDNGPNFWPNFFFIKKEILLKTDRNFASRAWKRGEAIVPLRYEVQDEITNGDTFVNASLQIRDMVPKDRILEIPQYHGSTDDWADYEKHVNLFDGKAPWIHVGSLSSGVHGNLVDDFGRCLARRKIDPEKPDFELTNGAPQTDQEKMEWERRVAFWEIFLGHAEPNKLIEFKQEYAKAVERIINSFKLDRERIKKRIDLYHGIGL